MEEEPKQKKPGFNWFGILVFIVVFAGPTLWRLVRPIVNGAGLSLPSGLPSLPVLVIGAIVVAVVATIVIQGVGRSQRRGDSRLPTTMSVPMESNAQVRPRSQQTNAPMPPFGGELGPFFPSFPSSIDGAPQPPSRTFQLPQPPQFEPIISGKALLAATGLFGVLGMTYLLAAAVLP